MKREDLEKKLNKLSVDVDYWYNEGSKTYIVSVYDLNEDFDEDAVEKFVRLLDKKANVKPTFCSPHYKFDDFEVLVSFESMDE